jgi:uncharacterized protein (DUF427 family)
MRYQAVWKGEVIADSDDTVGVEGNRYFPLADVRQDVLVESGTHTVCPWKGRASYYTVALDGQVNPDAAWYYPQPSFLARKVKGRVAFWRGVVVRPVED